MHIRVVIVAALCFVVAAMPGCRGRRQSRQKPNQKQPLVSPNGKFVLTVPTEKNPKQGGSHRWWTVTISDRKGFQLYKDPDSGFAG